jgi:hypothetical protein
LTYHAKRFLRGQDCQQQIVKTMLTSNAVLGSQIEFTQRSLSDWVKKAPKFAYYEVFAKKISTDCKEFNARLEDYVVKMHPSVIDNNIQMTNVLSAKAVDSCIVLHHAINAKFAEYQRDSTLKNVPTLFSRLDDSLYEAKFKAIALKIGSFNRWQQHTFLIIEMLHLKQLECVLIDKLMDLASRENPAVKLDKLLILVAPKKASVRVGEKFECDIMLGAYSSTANNIEIKCNGKKAAMKDGIAYFNFPLTKAGTQRLKAEATITNPATGQMQTIKSEFLYDVTE